MAKGKIKQFNDKKGYGFIERKGLSDLFFHVNQWSGAGEPRENMLVEFEEVQGKKGMEAKNVRPEGDVPKTTQKPKTSTTAPASSEYRFLNPYNFVRLLHQERPKDNVLGNCLPPPHDRYVGLTGRITCEVEAVTPLFISDSHAVEDQNGHKTYRFFQLDGKPALPASSLRGMFRSVFETVTNSCFVAFDKDKLSKHFPSNDAPQLVPARVEREGEKWYLRLLTGTTSLAIGQKPNGRQYAGWSASYWPVKPSKTLKGVGPRGQNPTPGQQNFIQRTQNRKQNPDNIQHGEPAYALLRSFQHPHPRIQFWDVIEVRRDTKSFSRPPQNGERVEHGWLCVNNQNIESKHSERFFFRAADNKVGPERIELSSNVRDAYESLISDYQKRHAAAVQQRRKNKQPLNKPIGDDAGFSRFVYEIETRKLEDGDLVYAFLGGSVNSPRVQFIAPVSVPRISYENNISDLIPLYYHRCTDYGSLCPACRIFGWVKEEGDEDKNKPTAYAGRVRFSHGRLTHNAGRLRETTLAILSSPKPTTTMFYLLNPQGQPDANVDYDTTNAQLRGRKFYRHFGNQVKEQEYQRAGNTHDDQNRTVRDALNPGAKFEFSLDFENLAPEELDALLYALQLEEGLYHRLGYAKPLGFGSVKVRVKEVQTINWQARLQSIEPNAGWQPLTDWQNYRQRFLGTMQTLYGEAFQNTVLADLHALLGTPPGLPIHYPRSSQSPEAEGKNYKWFMGNKRRADNRKKGKTDLPEPEPLSLPTEEAERRGLPLMDEKGQPV